MLALYRKYRPTKLSEVLGQASVTEPLEKALAAGKISHSYLLTGPRGCGKTSVARILAHEINGFSYTLEDSYLDIIEIDAASNTGVDNIRELREKALIAPSEGKYKVYIIDEVHMLSKSAFNALLKTLEEPPEHVVFILATTDLEKVPVTITSRSQVYRFKLADEPTLLPHLQAICQAEHIQISSGALKVLIARGGGSFRDTLSLLDQISSLADDKAKLSEEAVASALGLPLDSAVSALLSAYASADASAISAQLKDLLAEGLKPESIAEALLRKIIAAPSPALLPLLAKLPTVSAPYPEAKLLVALLSSGACDTQAKNSSGFERGSDGSFEANEEKTQSFSRNSQTSASSFGAEPGDRTRVRLSSEKNLTDFSPARKNPSTASPKVGTVLTPALKQQLNKCQIVEENDTVHIYPPQKITKLILDRPNNQELLASHFTKPFVIHSPEDSPVAKNSPKIAQISDIMGNVQEVNTDGGVPF